MKLSGFKALTFDCYGTLIDWETGLLAALNGLMTAEDIGSYKPSLRNFEYMLERLRSQGIEQGQILHVAQSLLHDHRPANELGLASCWIDRQHGRGGAAGELADRPRYDFTFNSMGDLAEAHRREVGG